MPGNSTSKSASKAAAVPLAKSDAVQTAKTANKNPVAPVPAAEPKPTHAVLQDHAASLRRSSKIFFGVFGVAGGIGKSLDTDVVADLYRKAGKPVEVIRLETEVRKAEFPGDAFVSLEAVTEAQENAGGAAGLCDDAFDLTVQTFAQNGIIILDGGANSHRAFVRVATETGLSQLVADLGGKTILMILVTRDADLIRQTVQLVEDLDACAPDAEIVIVLNERDGAFVDDATPEGRAYRELLAPLLQRQRHVVMPFAAARALAAFAGCGHSFSEIFAATDPELMAWSGLRRMAARSCQTHLGAFYHAFTERLLQVLSFRHEG
jgi:hypothetical protein